LPIQACQKERSKSIDVLITQLAGLVAITSNGLGRAGFVLDNMFDW